MHFEGLFFNIFTEYLPSHSENVGVWKYGVKFHIDCNHVDLCIFFHQLAEEEEIQRLRSETIPYAQLMPYFDRPFRPKRYVLLSLSRIFFSLHWYKYKSYFSCNKIKFVAGLLSPLQSPRGLNYTATITIQNHPEISFTPASYSMITAAQRNNGLCQMEVLLDSLFQWSLFQVMYNMYNLFHLAFVVLWQMEKLLVTNNGLSQMEVLLESLLQ